jgi:hypothetical protein
MLLHHFIITVKKQSHEKDCHHRKFMYNPLERILRELFFFCHSKFDMNPLMDLMTVFSVLPVPSY